VTRLVSTSNRTFDIPATKRMLDGTVATAELLLDTANVRLPAGDTAPGARLTFTSACVVLTTFEGVALRLPKASNAGRVQQYSCADLRGAYDFEGDVLLAIAVEIRHEQYVAAITE
jgi:hypothetical protein